jgi:predicted thioredoxin/glutaredoxin
MSFWDCGEYIATAAKLEVDIHLEHHYFKCFMFFRTLCNQQRVALMVNMMSVFFFLALHHFVLLVPTMVLKKLVAS